MAKRSTDTKTYLVREIPADVWQRAKARAAMEGTTMKAVVVELLKDYAKGVTLKH